MNTISTAKILKRCVKLGHRLPFCLKIIIIYAIKTIFDFFSGMATAIKDNITK